MDKATLKRLVSDPRFISGIYNYCDRWCQRCAFTDRCFNFASAQEEGATSRDINSTQFWEALQESFAKTLDLLREIAEEQGIDLDELRGDDSAGSEVQDTHEQVKRHPLAASSLEYARSVDSWFEKEPGIEEGPRREGQEFDPGFGGTLPPVEQASVQDCVEVIRWDQHLIHVKLVRALSGLDRDDGTNDQNGSCKVALISMDRSLGAWGRLCDHFPAKTDHIIDVLVQLDRLRRGAERVFPEARAFQRPGFDTEKAETVQHGTASSV
jgi:hypothetical protein